MRRAHDDKDEHHGHYNFHQRSGEEAVMAGRMVAITVGREAFGKLESGRAAGDEIEDGGADNGADSLRDDVGKDFPRRNPPSSSQADGHRGIEMAAGNM